MASDRLWRNSEKIVLLDTNAILMLFEFSINLEDELRRLIGVYKILIPDVVFNELQFLSEKGKGIKKRHANASLQLIKKYELIKIDSKKNTDDAIVSLTTNNNFVVVTNDKELRKRLKKNSVPVIFLRAKKKLVIE
jgi:rRNA-processing protein FCF1